MRHSASLVIASVFSLFALQLSAQPTTAQPSAADLQRAAAFFNASDWQHSLDAYSTLAKKFPTHALSVFRTGVSLVEVGRATEGEARLREGERLGAPPANAAFRLAEALAEQHQSDAAIEELMRASSAFFGVTPATLATDPHFASLKTHVKWPAVLGAFDALVRPCMHDARFREFDFWVGDWDVAPVAGSTGGPPGRNTITLEDDGCIVMEHWSAGPSTGQSFNLFDRSVGKWRQTWVDNSGGQHDYRGGLVDGNMVLIGDTPAPNGALGRIPTRLTLFHISRDSVRQFSEVSADGGHTWTVSYNLLYVRRK
ncbi:MAG: hypothetical protein ABI442_18595 [Gemmatimonadaceae bacterium]